MTPNHYPAAARLRIRPGDNDPAITPVAVVLHVDVGNSRSLFNWFNGPSGGIESHLFLRKDGTWEQYRTFDREADAQSGGNSWLVGGTRLGAISVETQGTALGWWTKAQKAALKDFLLWANNNLGIPLQVVRNAHPKSLEQGGVGYHSQFPSWNPRKKSCPGPRRISWFKNQLTPWLSEQAWQYVTVKDSDTLRSIADGAGTTVAKLWRLNRDPIRVGEKLRVR